MKNLLLVIEENVFTNVMKSYMPSIFPLVLFILLMLFHSVSFAQKTWSLTACVEYALNNNIELHQKANELKSQQIGLFESKIGMLPDLNMGSSVNLNFGRNIDGNTNAITYEQTLGNQFWVGSSIDIFNGFIKQNTIRYNHYLLSASKEDLSFAKNQLIFSVLSSYYTAVYSIGLMQVAQSQADLSELMYHRMQKFVDVGRESPIMVQELNSQWADDKLNLVRARNNMSKAMLELKQLLRLDASQMLSIDTVNALLITTTAVSNIDSLFSTAVQILPEIKQQEFLLKAKEKDLAVAKGSYFPRVYMSAGYNSNYFDGDTLAYVKQLENNQNQWVNLGISIPLFNHASVYCQRKRKEIALTNQAYELQKRKDLLYAEIVKARDELQSSENEYHASMESREFNLLSLKNVARKMEKGLAGATDFEASKQRVASAEAAVLKAKLIYIMRKQILEFYNSGNWNHLN